MKLSERPRYYDPYGVPYTGKDDKEILMKWCRDFERMDNSRIIAKTKIPLGRVSTVWLGLDHNFGDGPPLIYETMVFLDGGGPDDNDMERYSTRKEAIEGHNRMVEKWKTKN